MAELSADTQEKKHLMFEGVPVLGPAESRIRKWLLTMGLIVGLAATDSEKVKNDVAANIRPNPPGEPPKGFKLGV